MSTLASLIEKLEHAKKLDFGNIFNKSIELFKKVWVQGLVSYLLSMVLALPLFIVFYVPMVLLGLISPETFEGDIDIDGVGVLIIIFGALFFLLLFVGMITVSVGLKAAFFRIIKNKDLGQNTTDDYFFFFKKRYYKKTFGLSLVVFGIVILAYILCVLPIFYAIVPVYFIITSYAMNPDISNSDLVKIGFKLGNKKWLITFGLLFVAWLLSTVVGFLLCFIGLYVTQQFIDIPVYQVYKEVIGFDDKNAIDEIGEPVE
ncbi:hypothetical protein [Flavisericum labens]|uniref:hypothetical protein n=1 Tax=Flavisericum labens TaxID=3377112 RepID=UPI00387B7621